MKENNKFFQTLDFINILWRSKFYGDQVTRIGTTGFVILHYHRDLRYETKGGMCIF